MSFDTRVGTRVWACPGPRLHRPDDPALLSNQHGLMTANSWAWTSATESVRNPDWYHNIAAHPDKARIELQQHQRRFGSASSNSPVTLDERHIPGGHRHILAGRSVEPAS